ncbi:SPL family radical SAM protein [Sutcliffiella halmapala]|uniref:SPL family radical SAM protein n=1 Tax=Sutcliffiella halmapala TaxID=79882 RepID=UPI000995A94B|nr:radical SAM protein [Sutcliffiella halmapala]
MKVEVTEKTPQKILTPASGFLEGYTHSLNPYIGCAFGCSYCYVRQSPVGLFRKQEWGTWVDVKKGVKEKLEKELLLLRKKQKPITIFMSSSTDPYQPMEHNEQVTRALLEVMTKVKPDFLLVQTRSPLVVRDINLLLELKDRVMVSMTVETDLEEVRKRFSPAAPPIPARLKALKELRAFGIPVQVAIAPALPFSEKFPEALSKLVNRVCVDDFTGDGSGGKRTKRLKIGDRYEALEKENWYDGDVQKRVWERLRECFPEEQLVVSPEGFMPPKKSMDHSH